MMSSICCEPQSVYDSDKKLKRQDVQILQEWLRKQPHLPTLTELQVIIFLHSCYYSIEATKATIDIFYTRLTHYPHLFEHLSKDDLKIICSLQLAVILPEKTHQGCCVILFKIMDLSTENYNFAKVIRMLNMVLSLYLFKMGPPEGFVAIFDCKQFSLAHLVKFNLLDMKVALDHLQEGKPVRVKEIHMINVVPILNKALAIVKPLMKNELFDMIHIHSSFDTLHKHVTEQCLPEDYQGKLPSCVYFQEKNLERLLNNYDFFDWFDSFTVDESKRTEKTSDAFGIQGTFKKLNID